MACQEWGRIVRCFLCRSKDVEDAPFETQPPYSRWIVCRACGSQTAMREFDPGIYPDGFSLTVTEMSGGIDKCREYVAGNAAWFDRFHEAALPRTFLDVGCGDGAMLDVMQGNGWAVHGFDIARPHFFGPHITVHPLFSRYLFPMQYSAVCCREVIEHVPFPEFLLHELHGCCQRGGLVQIQTPSPVPHFDGAIHSIGHLFVASPAMLQEMITAAHFTIVDEMHWGDTRQAGQAYLCRVEASG